MTVSSAWFGSHRVSEGQMLSVRLGTLSIHLARRPEEWRLAWSRGDAPSDDEDSITAPIVGPRPIEDPGVDYTVERFPTRRAGETLDLSPRLADRPVVARPEMPLIIPAGDEAQIYVATPIWIHAGLPSPRRGLFELPAVRPSDTWFGPNTRRGIVAYASRTSARLEVANLPRVPYRAITRVRVRNRSDEALPLERLSVPAPSLTLYSDRNGDLWTAPLTVAKRDPLLTPDVDIEKHPPEEADGAKIVASPREPEDRSVVSRAFHVLVG